MQALGYTHKHAAAANAAERLQKAMRILRKRYFGCWYLSE